MISDKTLIEAIDKSPLSPEDKEHWKKLLAKLNEDQRERLEHSLAAKTEIRRAINLIERALKIISEAEAEAEAEVQKDEDSKKEKDELLQELEEIKDKESEMFLDEQPLKKKQEETHQEISKIRDELKTLSLEVHGQTPPSYQTPPLPKLPQIKRND